LLREAIDSLNVYNFLPHPGNPAIVKFIEQRHGAPVIITARGDLGPVNRWLEENDLRRFVALSSRGISGGKAELIKRLNLAGLVDDNAETVQAVIDSGRRGYLMARSWNESARLQPPNSYWGPTHLENLAGLEGSWL
jgi:hypothetical protein